MQQLGTQPARRGITGLTLFGGFASTVFVPLIQYLIESWGWRGALVGLGGINIVVCGGLYALTIRPRPLGIQAKTPATALAETRAAAATTWAMRQPVFWALAIALTAHAAMFAAFTFHFYPLLLEKGLSTQNVVAVIACIGPAQVAGRLVIWAIAPQASVPALGAALVAIFPLIFVAIALLPASVMGFMGVAIAFGAANGVMTIVKGLVVPSMLSSLAYGAINGILTAPGTVARAMAPMAAALLWAASGGYDRVVVALLGSSIVLALSFWLAVASYTQKRGQLEPPLA